MTDTAVYAVSRNAYNAALSDDATSNTFPAPVRMTEATVVYRLTPAQAGEMSSHMFTVRDALKAAGDAYSSQQARSLDRAATKMARILASQPVAETTAADTDENRAMQQTPRSTGSPSGNPADHRITIDFLGTDVERPFGSKLVYGVSCSCGSMVGSTDAVSHLGADVRIAQHLESVGLLNQSYTQH